MLKHENLLSIYHSHGPYELILWISEPLTFYSWVEGTQCPQTDLLESISTVNLMCSINKCWKIDSVSQNSIRKIHMLKSSPLHFSWLCCWFLTIDFSYVFLSFSGNRTSTTSLGSLFHWQAVITRIYFNAYTIANPSLKLAHHQYFVMTTDKTKLHKSHWD